MNKISWITRTALAGALLATAPMALQATAQERTVQFSIPAQPLGDALRAYALATGEQIIFSGDIVAGRQAPALEGAFSGDAGLERLLAGSGLVARRTERGSIMILRADDPRATAPIQIPSRAAAADDRADGDRIVVTGTNIRGVHPDSSPVQVFTADDIARTGATTTEEFVSKLPQNLGTRVSLAASTGIVSSFAAQNREAVNGIDLRGLGAGTTLVLINGRRPALSSFGQAFDVSVIPTAVIERVEVLSDGASAIYGADAIGGVVNFVLRDDFDGVESTGSFGAGNGKHRVGQVGHTIGRSWESGNALTSISYLSASPLDTMEREFSAPAGPGFLSPIDQRYGVFSSLRQDIGERARFSGDLMVSHRNVKNETSDLVSTPILILSKSGTDQYFANAGLDFDLTSNIGASLAASYSETTVDSAHRTRLPAFGSDFTNDFDTRHSALDLTAKLDGTLFSLPAGEVGFSLGAGTMEEEYRASRTINSGLSRWDLGRRTSYAFGELFIPVLGPAQNVPFFHRLELSLAGRHTDYEDKSTPSIGADFGDKFSPKVGLLWGLTPDLRVRATFGESFRAPTLSEADPSARSSQLPARRLVGGVLTQLLIVQGPTPNLRPETADSYTVGVDWNPASRPSFEFSATYFNIDYHDRVAATGAFNLAAFADPAAWPEKIYFPSSVEQLASLLVTYPTTSNVTGISLADPLAAAQQLMNLPSFVVNDSRTLNLAQSKLDGLDIRVTDHFELPWASLRAGADFTHVFSYREQVTASAPVLSVVDTLFRPASLRGRIHAGLTRDAFDTNVSVNYVDDYTNPYAIGGPQEVKSWTTVDWNASYDFVGDIRLSIAIQNIFDADPPFIARGDSRGLVVPVGFDPANANPFGRTATLTVTKRW